MPLRPDDADMLAALGAGVEAARAEAETVWGRERLPLLLDDELRTKMNRQTRRWSEAYAAAWQADVLTRSMLEDVETRAAAMQRMYPALGAAASEAGHRPLSPKVWETLLSDGTVMAVVQTNDDAAYVIAEGRYVVVCTLAEVANIWDALPKALQVAKVIFPGATVLRPTDKSWVRDGDPIPFGDAA